MMDLLRMSEIPKLVSYLEETIGSKEQRQPMRVVLVTYNRVGKGEIPAKVVRGKVTLEIYSMDHMPSEDEVSELYDRVAKDFLSKVGLLNKPVLYIVYGGGVERFRESVGLVVRLTEMARFSGKRHLLESHLVTCLCDLETKVKIAQPACKEGQVSSIAFNPNGECGGFADMQTIADAVLRSV